MGAFQPRTVNFFVACSCAQRLCHSACARTLVNGSPSSASIALIAQARSLHSLFSHACASSLSSRSRYLSSQSLSRPLASRSDLHATSWSSGGRPTLVVLSPQKTEENRQPDWGERPATNNDPARCTCAATDTPHTPPHSRLIHTGILRKGERGAIPRVAVSHVCPRASATPDLPSRSPSPTLAPPSCRLAVVHSLRSPSCRAPPLPLSVRVANSFSPHSQYASCGAVDRWRSPRERAHGCVCARQCLPPSPPPAAIRPPRSPRASARRPSLAPPSMHIGRLPRRQSSDAQSTPLQLSAPVDRARARSAREPTPQAGHSRLTRTVTLLAGALGAHQAPPRCLAQIGDDRALTSGKRLQSPRRPRRRRRRPSRRARRPVARGSVRAGTRRRRLSPTTSRRLNKMELRPLLTRRRPTPR